jgi:predicted CXXCH cytochrome family protein
MMAHRRKILLSLSGFCLLLAGALLVGAQAALAAHTRAAQFLAQASTPGPAQLSISNETCLGCHGQPNLSMELGNGEILSLYVPNEVYEHSVHGDQGYACVQCHTDVGNYPHPPFFAEDRRDATLQMADTCARCHSLQAEETMDSVHAAALAAGNENAAVCSDCHTAHAVRRVNDPQTQEHLPDTRVWTAQTCAQCHSTIYQTYSTSVHGTALLGEGNPDVPTCTDCHGVHTIDDPNTAAFRLRSPNICANCHTDASIMGQYGLSTQVLDTYVADFHGTTWTLFEQQHPDQQINMPVCYDCHGVHDIRRTDDPVKGLQVKENLLITCQKCHPDATANFPDAWLSHYIPDAERFPLVFAVNLFYRIFIPVVLGGMAVLVVLDTSALLRRKLRRGKAAHPAPPLPSPEEVRQEAAEIGDAVLPAAETALTEDQEPEDSAPPLEQEPPLTREPESSEETQAGLKDDPGAPEDSQAAEDMLDDEIDADDEERTDG